MKGSTVKTLSIVLTVIGVLCSAVLSFSAELDAAFGFVTFIGFLISLFLFIFPWFIMAELLTRHEETQMTLSKVNALLKSLGAEENSGKPDLSTVASVEVQNGWSCPTCGKTNPTSSRTCKDCGYQK